ncbi:DMT family transporter [Caenimonas aquaedulcis]|uniref:DMT family transporter n=1 Tax=Caenimonas aquaedulcis TaxID=2793270 RepID=A0A931MGU9_9BURK|nr:DMT family transporter [Caenimonas aquaedulcis]MBG9388323.1 DMT family transporter [Caenimonas aquaedulcis]
MKTDNERKPRLLGWAAATAMVLIATGWQLVTRAGVRSELAPWDLALLRYGVPALLLAPVWRRCGLRPAGLPAWRLAALVAGAGLPFGLLAMAGASFAPAAHMGALLPGASPLLVAALGALVFGSRPGLSQGCGLALLATGLALITLPGWTSGTGHWRGDALFLVAALLWATYTLALRGGGLTAWESAAVISAWSALCVVPLWIAAYASGRSLMFHASPRQVALQVLWQGCLAGVVGLAVFAAAVRRLGPAATSAAGALVPALVAVGGWLLLDEPLGLAGWCGIATVAAGAWMASRPPRPASGARAVPAGTAPAGKTGTA